MVPRGIFLGLQQIFQVLGRAMNLTHLSITGTGLIAIALLVHATQLFQLPPVLPGQSRILHAPCHIFQHLNLGSVYHIISQARVGALPLLTELTIVGCGTRRLLIERR